MSGMYQFNALVENNNGLLNDLMALASASDCRVCHFNLAPVQEGNLEFLTMVVKASAGSTARMARQMDRLEGVSTLAVAEQEKGWDRELVLLKVAARQGGYSSVVQLASVFGATVLSEGPDWVVLMASGPRDRVDAFVHNLKPYGILEMGRTGQVTMAPFNSENQEQIRPLGLNELVSQAGDAVHLAEM